MFLRSLSLVVCLSSFVAGSAIASGAGVLPYFDDGTVLVGKEWRQDKYKGVVQGAPYLSWSEFGGKRDQGETLPQAAFREFKEETGHYSFPQVTVNKIEQSPFFVNRSYSMYLVHIPGKKPTIADIMKNAAQAEKNLGKHKAHVEKSEWMYIDAQVLLNTVYSAHGNKNIHVNNHPACLYPFFVNGIKGANNNGLLAPVLAKAAPKAVVPVKAPAPVVKAVVPVKAPAPAVKAVVPVKAPAPVVKAVVPVKAPAPVVKAVVPVKAPAPVAKFPINAKATPPAPIKLAAIPGKK